MNIHMCVCYRYKSCYLLPWCRIVIALCTKRLPSGKTIVDTGHFCAIKISNGRLATDHSRRETMTLYERILYTGRGLFG